MGDVEHAICRIGRDGRVVGLGFAVDRWHVVSCAHVVNAALGRALRECAVPPGGARFDIVFPIGRQDTAPALTAQVVVEGWLPSDPLRFDGDDAVLLRLSAPVPQRISPVVPGAMVRGVVPIQVWGPILGRPAGGHAVGELRGEVADGRVQIDLDGHGFRARRGFSGGPVWHRATGEVLGMLAACGEEESAVDAYLLPSSTIARIWPSWADRVEAPLPDSPAVARLARVEDAARFHPRFRDARLERRGSASVPCLLATVQDRDGEMVFGSSVHALGSHSGPTQWSDIEAFRAVALAAMPAGTQLASAYLIVFDGSCPAEVRSKALQARVVVQSFAEFQGGFDLRPFARAQHERLLADTRYPRSLYVRQDWGDPAVGDRHRTSLVEQMLAWLAEPEGQLVVVLAPFGSGKTYLLHELALAMGEAQDYPATPVLIRMRDLDLAHDVDDLLLHELRHGGQTQLDIRRLEYLRREGRIVLLFDGFDELARRSSYAQAQDQLAWLAASAKGRAKVVITSRREHFLNEDGARAVLATRYAAGAGVRLVTLEQFTGDQIGAFLMLRLGDEAARRWIGLLERFAVADLAANPRMLQLISELDEQDLDRVGTLTRATLLRRLVDSWLDIEHARLAARRPDSAPSREQLFAALVQLAQQLWESGRADLGPDDLAAFAPKLSSPDPDGTSLTGEEAAHLLGSGSLLVRNGNGRFEFAHRSIAEWLVVAHIAERFALSEPGTVARPAPADVLAVDLSSLQLDLLGEILAPSVLSSMIHAALTRGSPRARTTALALARHRSVHLRERLRLGGADLSGADLSGQDLAGADLSHADLTGADLSGADLMGADLTGAILVRTVLRRARLSRAVLRRADLTGALLLGADLSDTDLSVLARAERAVFTGARLSNAARAALLAAGATADQPPVVKVMPTSDGNTYTLAVHPSGQYAAAGGNSYCIRVWDLVSGRLLHDLTGHTGQIHTLAWSPDGRRLASGCDDHTVKIWDGVNGTLVRTLSGHTAHIRGVAWSSDGSRLASRDYYGGIRIWDGASGALQNAFSVSTRLSSSAIVWSPDGRHLAMAQNNQDTNTVVVVDADTGRTHRILDTMKGSVWAMAWSPDGRTLAAGSSRDNLVRIWNTDDWSIRHTLAGHTWEICCAAWSPDSRVLATAGESVRLWDGGDGRELDVLPSAKGVAWSGDGRRIVTADLGGAIEIRDAKTRHLLSTLTCPDDVIRATAWSPDGRSCACVTWRGRLMIWDAHDGRLRHVLSAGPGLGTEVAWSPDGRVLASSFRPKEGDEASVQLWNPEDGSLVRTLSDHYGFISGLLWSPDARQLAVATDQKALYLWDSDAGRLLRTVNAQGTTKPGPYSGPHGTLNVLWSDEGALRISERSTDELRTWDPATGRILRTIRGGQDPDKVANWFQGEAWSPDGRYLATGHKKALKIWTGDDLRLVHVLPSPRWAITRLAWSPDSRHLISNGGDAPIVWDVTVGRQLLTLDGVQPDSTIWSPDGQRVAGTSADGGVRVWDTATWQSERTYGSVSKAIRLLEWSPDGQWLSTTYGTTISLYDIAADARAVVLVPLRDDGWAVLYPDGRYKHHGATAGEFFYTLGPNRFEAGELDEFVAELVRVPEDTPLRSTTPPTVPTDAPPSTKPAWWHRRSRHGT